MIVTKTGGIESMSEYVYTTGDISINSKRNPNIPIICPICKSENVKPFNMVACIRMESPGLTINHAPTITQICNDCGYLMFFMRIKTEGEKLKDAEENEKWK